MQYNFDSIASNVAEHMKMIYARTNMSACGSNVCSQFCKMDSLVTSTLRKIRINSRTRCGFRKSGTATHGIVGALKFNHAEVTKNPNVYSGDAYSPIQPSIDSFAKADAVSYQFNPIVAVCTVAHRYSILSSPDLWMPHDANCVHFVNRIRFDKNRIPSRAKEICTNSWFDFLHQYFLSNEVSPLLLAFHRFDFCATYHSYFLARALTRVRYYQDVRHVRPHSILSSHQT